MLLPALKADRPCSVPGHRELGCNSVLTKPVLVPRNYYGALASYYHGGSHMSLSGTGHRMGLRRAAAKRCQRYLSTTTNPSKAGTKSLSNSGRLPEYSAPPPTSHRTNPPPSWLDLAAHTRSQYRASQICAISPPVCTAPTGICLEVSEVMCTRG